MQIHGLQKLTLLDYPGRTACTIFTGACNLRCPFCHNASLVLRTSDLPTVRESEIFSFLEKRRGLLDGVAVTGGEPTLQPDLPEFLSRVHALGYAVKLDTNGTRPDVLETLLRDRLLDYAAIDVKAAPDNYAAVCGIPGYDPEPVLKSIRLLEGSAIPHEFRTTAVSPLHSEADFRAIADLLCGTERYFIQSFKDSGDILAEGMSAFPVETLHEFLRIVQEKIPNAQLRGVE